MSFIIQEGEVFQLDDEGNPIAPDAGAAAVALPATQGGVIGAGKRASDGKPAIIRTDDDGRQTITADALPLPTGAATESTLSTRATEATLATVATEATLSTLGTEATASASDAKLATIDAVLDSIKDTDGIKKITDPLPAGTNNIGDVDVVSSALPAGAATEATLATRASETTLSSADAKLGTIDSVLDSIKDTDGIKKITDQLPAGTNEIGLVAQGTKAAASDAWPTVLYDASGNAVGIILDNSIYRLEARSKLAGQLSTGGSEIDVTVIADTENADEKRLQTQARIAPGSTVNIGTGIPSNPADLVIDFAENGGSEDLLVNGSGTPVAFTYGPSTGTVSIEEVRIVFAADDFDFDGSKFGPNSALTNGVLFETVIDSVATPIFTIFQNEDFPRIPGRPPLINNTGPKDVLVASFGFGGLLKLDSATSDVIRVTVRDNLTSVKFKYFTATIFGAKE